MVAKAKAEQKIEREKRMAYYANLRKQMAERDLTSEESSEASEAEESEAESESAIEKASKSSKTAPSSVVDDEPGQYVSANESSLEEITVESRPSKVIDDKTKTITKVIFNCFSVASLTGLFWLKLREYTQCIFSVVISLFG